MKTDKTKPKVKKQIISPEVRDAMYEYWRTHKENQMPLIAKIFNVREYHVIGAIDFHLNSKIPHFEPDENIIDEIEDVDEINE